MEKNEGNGFFCRFVFVYRIGRMILCAHVAQLVERVLGKDEVISSTLIMGSSLQIIADLTVNQKLNAGDNNG